MSILSKLFEAVFSKNKPGSVTVNGVTYVGSSVNITNTDAGTHVYVDGKRSEVSLGHVINVQVDGDVDSLISVSGDVSVKGSVQKVSSTSGDIFCGDVVGDVQTVSGDVQANHISGNVSTVSGDINT